jgi:hypothetical protein
VLPLPALLDDVLERSGYRAMLADGTEEGEERWANLLELREVTTRYDDLSAEDALDRLLEETALVADQESYQSAADLGTPFTAESVTVPAQAEPMETVSLDKERGGDSGSAPAHAGSEDEVAVGQPYDVASQTPTAPAPAPRPQPPQPPYGQPFAPHGPFASPPGPYPPSFGPVATMGPGLAADHGPVGVRLLDEPIPQSDDGLDLVAGRAQLGAQASDVDVHRSRFDQPVVAPDAFEQPVARQDAALVLDQALE